MRFGKREAFVIHAYNPPHTLRESERQKDTQNTFSKLLFSPKNSPEKTTKNELNEMTTEYCNRDVAFRPRKRRRKFTFISPLFALLLILLIAQIAFVKGAAFASGEDDNAGSRRTLVSDVVDAR